ncbi:DUF6000 family protein [Polaribacter sp. Asnod1-A03]|uniref:DUF6000 family protein n=1 Tax=Polaribacter sp. Asnod1-A03 TaxID=3160581 RepID=UPI00386835AA
MDEQTKRNIELHSAGATVRHKSPFENLEHYESETKIDKEFINKWVLPFYMSFPKKNEFISDFNEVKSELNIEIAKKLLGNFNWRTRIVGAYFATIQNYTELENIIGIHLLKSQVCYAGEGYCFALASFNTENSIGFLKKYLDYYLTRKDLQFEQSGALLALNWTDKQNGTNDVEKYLPIYKEWNSSQYSQDIKSRFEHFNRLITELKNCR